MSENNVETIAEETPKKERISLRKSDLWKSFLIWEFWCETCLSYERLQSTGFCHAMVPILKRLYKTKEDLADGLTRHMSFFNTENNWGSLIPGMVASMEEERANGGAITGEAINSIKIGLMGPMAGIGDTITQGLMKNILLAIALDFATKGSLLGPLFYFLTFTTYLLVVDHITFFQGYRLGKSAFSKVSDPSIMRKITDSLAVLGLTVAGALVANHVKIKTALVVAFGETSIEIQSLFNQIMPGLLSILAVGLILYFLQKNVSVVKIMGALCVIGLIGAVIGFF